MNEPVLSTLRTGEMHLEGRIIGSSNQAWRVILGDEGMRAVYKPVAGEKELWDFPDGNLASREVATYLISDAGGWDLVPETVLRTGPLGPGSLQRWVVPTDEGLGEKSTDGESDSVAPGLTDPEDLELVALRPDIEPGWLPVVAFETESGAPVHLVHADLERLRSLAVLDAVVNNTDRKAGHILLDDDRAVGIDHGLTLHAEPKLRTVLWGWAGDPLAEADRQRLDRLATALAEPQLQQQLGPLLTPAEIEALQERVHRLRASGRHPLPGDWHPLPWPLW
ncbi:SCO1664 family protein [Dermacoccaceae bacterium W4C1]